MNKKNKVKEFQGLQYKKFKISYKALISVILSFGIILVMLFNFSCDENGPSFKSIDAKVEIKKTIGGDHE